MTALSCDDAKALAARTDFVWHQRFELCEEVFSPGANDVGFLMGAAELPEDLRGASVLDIGTTNGGAAFMAERRGAERVVATDIFDAGHFGFEAIRDALGSSVEFQQLSVYELSHQIAERFDIVLFWGVLYHLRHPLLALDNVRSVAAGRVYIETAVCDGEVASQGPLPVARFYRRDELGADCSNWFAPSLDMLLDWCASSGLEPTAAHSWPEGAPERAMVSATRGPNEPEYALISYERPLQCVVQHEIG